MASHRTHPNNPDLIWCAAHNQYHSADQFYNRIESRTGKHGTCKDAMKAKEAVRRERKKAERVLI